MNRHKIVVHRLTDRQTEQIKAYLNRKPGSPIMKHCYIVTMRHIKASETDGKTNNKLTWIEKCYVGGLFYTPSRLQKHDKQTNRQT